MILRIIHRLMFLGLLALILTSVVFAAAAANTVPATNLDGQQFSITINDLKPAQCAGINVANIITGSGIFTGTGQSDLLIGDTGVDRIFGLNGDDCIVGGDGDDRIFGGGGADVCIGGPGDDTFNNCTTVVQ